MTVLYIIGLIVFWKQWRQRHTRISASQDRTRPLLLNLPESALPEPIRHCRVSMRYYRLLNRLNWSQVPIRPESKSYCQHPTPFVAFIVVCLVKIDQQYKYMTQVHDYFLDHPALIWLVGFTNCLPAPDRVEESLPTARHFTRMLREMPNEILQKLLGQTVTWLQRELPDFGISISLDTKHIIAWVKQNNPKAYTEERFNKEKQPQADSDCRLGCKRRRNFKVDAEAPVTTPLTNPIPAKQLNVGEYYWGYASGIVATKVAGWGEFVIAEWTQTLDRPDVSYFFPLLQQTEKRLGKRPQFGSFDAAFDAYYVYEYFHRDGMSWQAGFAAVPLTQRTKGKREFDTDGQPICEAGLRMTTQYRYQCRTTLIEHERAVYSCPIRETHDACPIHHKKWHQGGCKTRLPTSIGTRLRHWIDRESDLYQQIYKQRTATERINAQAVALGIERPKLRNKQAITNLNTLIYILINLRAIQRICKQKAVLA